MNGPAATDATRRRMMARAIELLQRVWSDLDVGTPPHDRDGEAQVTMRSWRALAFQRPILEMLSHTQGR